MRFTHILFDLDGTLLNTIPDLTEAINAMLARLGKASLSQDLIATYVGKGAQVLVERAVAHGTGRPADGQLIARAMAHFNQYYHQVNGTKTLLYPGVLDGLQAFQAMGSKMAIVTNKPAQFTLPLLERTGLHSFFEHTISGDTCARKKPDPMPLLHACDLLGGQPGQTLMIGDSINDVQAARAAGISVLAVPYGYNEGLAVQQLKADAIVSSIYQAALWVQKQP